MKPVRFTLLLLFSSLVIANTNLIEDAENDRVLFNQALSMSSSGEWDSAAKIFRGVALRHPQWPEPKNNLAIALYNMGQLELARQALDEAVISLPGFKTAQENRQLLYDYAASIAYTNAVDDPGQHKPPKLKLLTEIRFSAKRSKQMSTIDVITEQNDIEQRIRDSVIEWSSSWSAADTQTYLLAYSANFKPSNPEQDIRQWRTDRTARLRFGKIDRVSVQSLTVFLDNRRKNAVAQFVQHYQSRNYQDKVIKQLQLVLEEGRWLILSETVLQQLN